MNLWREPRSLPAAIFFLATLIPRVIIFAIGVCLEERR